MKIVGKEKGGKVVVEFGNLRQYDPNIVGKTVPVRAAVSLSKLGELNAAAEEAREIARRTQEALSGN